MTVLPEIPASALRASVDDRLRYDDVGQDGQLFLLGVPHAVGPAIWGTLLADHPIARASRAGVVALLTRAVIEGGEGPVSVGKPVRAEGAFELAHALGEDGQVARLLLRAWVSLHAPRSRMLGPPPPGAGEMVCAGRMYAESTFTRSFGPPGERRVVRFEGFDLGGLDPVPPSRVPLVRPDVLLALPEGARPLDEGLQPDAAPTAFGVLHTDGNQHVNSMVYPRLFEEAVLRRLALLGRSTRVGSRRIEAAYRKPCFAGESLRILVRCFETEGGVGAVGGFFTEGAGASERPRCYLRILLSA